MKITEILIEGVAGPKNCWPGHRKVGTQPGTGKNAGKPVNKCKKIGEDSVEEIDEAKKKGLYDYVNKRKKDGTSRDASSPKAPTAQAWKDAQAGKAVSVPGWQYKLLVGFITLAPRPLVRRVGMNLRVKQR